MLQARGVCDYRTDSKMDEKVTEIRGQVRAALGHAEGITLVLTSPDNYQSVAREIVRYLAGERGMPGVYATVNKPASALKDEMGVAARNICFVDAITPLVSAIRQSGEMFVVSKRGIEYAIPQGSDGCVYVKSPENLTDISTAISESMDAISSEDKFMIFDSLSTLLLYNDAASVARFAHFLTGRLRMWRARGVLLSVENGSGELVSQLSQFCDTVVRIDSGTVARIKNRPYKFPGVECE